MATTQALERSEGLGSAEFLAGIDLKVKRLLRLSLSLQIRNSRTVKDTSPNTAGLEGTSIKPVTVGIKTLADDFAALHDDAAMTVVEWGERSLLEAESEIVVSLHFEIVCVEGLVEGVQGLFVIKFESVKEPG